MNYNLTVKAWFELAKMYVRESDEIWLSRPAAFVTDEEKEKSRKALEAAARCRANAYKMLGVPTVDENNRHMGELMADF